MKIHREILGRRQRKALAEIGPAAAAAGFYLGGGTALALRFGHRLSVDLDWFSDERLGDPARLAAELRGSGAPLVTTMTAEGTLYGMPQMIWDVGWDEVKGRIIGWIREAAGQM